MVANRRTLTWLSWVLVILAIVSAAVTLLFATGILRPPEEIADLVERLIAFRGHDQAAFPFVVVGGVASIGVYLIVAMLGLALRAWARPSSLRDAMSILLVVGGVVGIVGQLVNIGVGEIANPFYCDCGYKAEEVIAQQKTLDLGWTIAAWLGLGALTMVGIGAGVTGRIVKVSPVWQTLSGIIAIALLVGVALRVLAAFIFVGAFDPYQVSDLIVAATAGILVPIWAILLARGASDPHAEAVAGAA
jgi:hypothetical protein